MKKLLLIAAASATILSSTLSFADCAMDTTQAQNENKWYLKANAGASMFDKVTDKTTNLKMKSNTSFIGEIGVGSNVTNNIRADLTLGMVTNTQFKKSAPVTTGTYAGWNGSIKHKPNIATLLVNGYVDFVDVSILKLFAGAGIGIASIQENITLNFTQPNIGFSNNKDKYTSTNFAYQVSLGASAEVADGVKAELVYSWRDYGKTATKSYKSIFFNTPVNIGGTRYKGHNVMAGIRFDI